MANSLFSKLIIFLVLGGFLGCVHTHTADFVYNLLDAGLTSYDRVVQTPSHFPQPGCDVMWMLLNLIKTNDVDVGKGNMCKN